MNLLKNTILASLLAFALVGCDVIEGEKVDYSNLPAGAGKKVLLEDFTGHQCGNCPRAHEQGEALKATYGDDLIVVAIHAGGFSNVIPQIGYTADYTTSMGDELLVHYDADNEGLPVGMINRRSWNDNKVLQKFAAWGSQVAAVLGEEPALSIDLDGSIDENLGMLEANVEMEYFAAGNESHHLTVILTEDGIVSKQADYDLSQGYVPDYEHKHMLQANLSKDTWGDQIKTGAIFAGETFSVTYSLAIDPSWDLEKLSLVAYVSDNTTKEVLQAEEHHLE